MEFDKCYENYALVDVAALGFGKKENLIKNHAKKGDLVVLMGGSTGRDGIGGSQFALILWNLKIAPQYKSLIRSLRN